jgi:predicted AlkP superfamily phosphohydrolase/phosphomutase
MYTGVMPSALKLLVIGLDGASYNLIDPLAEKGLLPNLSSVMSDGARGRLVSTVPWQTPVAWTSYATGVNPGAHGIYGWWVPDTRSGELRTSSGRQVDQPRFWEVLSSSGQRVGVVNIPMSYPARPVNGFWISGFDGPFLCMEDDPLISYPPGLLPTLQSSGFDYRILPDRRHDEPAEDAAKRWKDVEDTRVKSVIALAKQFEPHFLQVNLFITDHFAHRSRVGDRTLEIAYSAADQGVGELLELATEDTTVLIVSDHGSQPISHFILVHLWLQQLGMLAFHPWVADEQVECVANMLGESREDLILQMRREGPALRERLYEKVRSKYPGANIGFTTIDWDQTKAFCSSDYGQITLNRTRGKAAVKPSEESEILKTLTAAFQSLVDSETGEPLVAEIIPRSTLYRGMHENSGPDLTPVLRDHSYYFCQVYSFYREGVKQVVCPVHEVVDPLTTGNLGDHHPYGILMARGPEVRRGQVADASILDIAPTVLNHFGIRPLPHHEGTILRDLFGGRREDRPAPKFHEHLGQDALKHRLIELGYRI